MRQRRGLRPALITAIAGGVTLALASPAWADTNPVLRQSGQHILASNGTFNQGFGKCSPEQNADEDIWVFIWPGNSAGDLTSVKIGWDTDNDGTADTFKELADGHRTTDQGALKVWFATPAGWKLESGESTITGTVPQDKFNLTHTCAGTPSDKPSPSPSSSDEPGETPSPTPSESETPGNEPSSPAPDDEGGLPLTGAAAGAIALAGVALVGGGTALMVMRRRRDNITFTS